jgi:1-acyl-sn-glycerol-3-phosphate acyltransferase
VNRLAAALRIALRAPLALALLIAGLAIVVLVFPRIGWHRRDRTVAAWSRLLLRACGVRLVELPAPGATPLAELRGGVLLLANHVNWLDIFLVLSVAPAHFVAKIEIARWPLIGALVAGVGTLFVERGRRRAVHQLNDRIGNMLRAARRVAVFPEGTTSDGGRLLQFHGNLVEPALRAGVPVVPVGLRYTGPDGRPTAAVRFVGEMGLGESLRLVLGAPGIRAELHPLPAVRGGTRQEVAAAARLALAGRLGLPMDDEVSETLRRARVSRQGSACS